MNVLVIPEDFRKDEGILDPIIRKMLSECGKPNARVRVCKDPLLGGVSQALNAERIQEIILRYRGMVNLFILCVDRDNEINRRSRLDQLEIFVKKNGATLFAENAWQEIEVWVLAGHDDLPRGWRWADIRSDRDPKEHYYLPFAESKKVIDQPAEGRKVLTTKAVRRYDRIRQLCPEDIGALHTRIENWLEDNNCMN